MSPKLNAPLSELLDDPSDEVTIERIRRRVGASRRVPSQRAWPALAAAAVVLLVGAALYATTRGDGAVERADGAALARMTGPARVALSDGSELALGAGAVVETVENTAERVLLVQGDGRVVYEVRPGGPRRWSVDAGAVTVDVVGTRFVVDRAGERVRVEVERGHVRVRGPGVPGGIQALERGEATEVGAPARADLGAGLVGAGLVGAGLVGAGPAAAGLVGAGPAAAGPAAAGPAAAGPVGAGPVGAGPVGAGPVGARGAAWAEGATQGDAEESGSAASGSAALGSAESGSAALGSAASGSAALGSAALGSAASGSAASGSAALGSAESDSAALGSAESGSAALGSAGSGSAASGGAASGVREAVAEPGAREPAAPTGGPGAAGPASTPGERRAAWRRLARDGRYDEAFAALGEDGFREASARARTVDELWALSDTARLSGHPAHAVAPLRRIVAEHASSPRASVAALSLGRLQLDALDAPAEAARSLALASELGLPAHLRETALAREVEAHRRAGHLGQARTLAASYLAQYPEGRYRDAVRRGL